jgi:hypothetical protein
MGDVCWIWATPELARCRVYGQVKRTAGFEKAQPLGERL